MTFIDPYKQNDNYTIEIKKRMLILIMKLTLKSHHWLFKINQTTT